MLEMMCHKLNVAYNLFSSFVSFVFGVFFLFLQEGIEGGDKWYANLLKGEQITKTCGNMGT